MCLFVINCITSVFFCAFDHSHLRRYCLLVLLRSLCAAAMNEPRETMCVYLCEMTSCSRWRLSRALAYIGARHHQWSIVPRQWRHCVWFLSRLRAGDSRRVFATLSYFWSKLLPLLTETGSYYLLLKKSGSQRKVKRVALNLFYWVIDRPEPSTLMSTQDKLCILTFVSTGRSHMWVVLCLNYTALIKKNVFYGAFVRQSPDAL